MDNKSYVLVHLRNFNNWLERKLQIYTDNILTIWQSNLVKVGESLEESTKYLTVGLKADQCLMPKFIIPSVQVSKNLVRFSLPILLVRELIKQEDGSIH